MPHVEVPSAEFKVVLLGDTNTGKTCLVLRLVEGSFRPSGRSATVGAFFLTKRLTVNNITCKMLLWDTAGQEQFQRLAKTYYQNAAAAIICYDISNPRSLARLKKSLDELNRYKQNSPMVLTIAACKSDLSSVPGLEEEAKRMAKAYDAIYVRTSAKANKGVFEVFQKTAARVLEWHELAVAGQARPLHVTVGALTQRERLSPSTHALRKHHSTGFKPSDDGGILSGGPSPEIAKSNIPTLDQDSATEIESDDVNDMPFKDGDKEHKLNCEGAFIVCGIDEGPRTCCIL
ncbi:hypothetical protein ACA910_004931 [Epithemia clementina (nom. ined.)]